MVKKVPACSFAVSKVCVIVFFVLFSPLVLVAEAQGPTLISVNPVSQTISAGDTVIITVDCLPEQPVKTFELKLSFNPSILLATSVSEGSFFDGYNTFFNAGIIDNVAGTIVNIYDLIIGPGNVTGAGSFVTINFTAKSTSGASSLTLYDVRVTNETDYIDITVTSASITVIGSNPPQLNPPPSSENNPPQVPLKPSGPTLIELGTSYMYSSAAFDPDGDQVRLRFDWGGGSLSEWTSFVVSNTSVSASHAWGNVSTYIIRVIAQDENGSNSSWSDPLTVIVSQASSEGSPPVGVFSIPQNVSSNQNILFDASGSYDPDGVIVSYLWDFGDEVTGTGANPVHVYRVPGQYTVTLTVTDNSGLTYSYSQIVSIPLGAVVPAGDGNDLHGNDFLQSNSSVIILIIASVTLLILLFVFRNNIQDLFLQKRIETSQRRLAQFDRNTADIGQIVDELFSEMKHKTQIPSKDSILDAYCDAIIEKVKANADVHLPDLSLAEVEKIVDDCFHSKISEKIDKM